MAPVRGAKKAVRMRMSRLAASVDCLYDTAPSCYGDLCEFSTAPAPTACTTKGLPAPWHDSRTRYGRDYEVSP